MVLRDWVAATRLGSGPDVLLGNDGSGRIGKDGLRRFIGALMMDGSDPAWKIQAFLAACLDEGVSRDSDSRSPAAPVAIAPSRYGNGRIDGPFLDWRTQ